MDRKTFLKKTASTIIIGIPAYSILSCSSGGDDSPNPNPNPNPNSDCLANGTNTAIGANHGHTLSVSKADVEAGVQKTYSIQGSSPHNHEVTLSASHFSSLKSNQQITVSSTSADAHSHSITVSCA